MPCDSAYLEPTSTEREAAKVLLFLRILGGAPVPDDLPRALEHAADQHPRIGKTEVAALCHELRQREIEGTLSTYPFEMQIWWRDHKRADADRQRREAQDIQQKAVRNRALAKLTPEERRALGV